MRAKSGRPEKNSPSSQTVPASRASRSVADICGTRLRAFAAAASQPNMVTP